ncbi:hypothetical protein [Ectobacillus ponti]|uniref:Uncharacterized protein n=1 Tax=Ectobacillus ponti TaxID=2961894 RepID=A0AA41X1V1_9BACI|nr:hypothetical protein [Ectobacillus ponti]MCP8967207.1 hypothetical protein [Ectobacillus ponti]
MHSYNNRYNSLNDYNDRYSQNYRHDLDMDDPSMVRFLGTLSPGTRVTLQYDAQRPAAGVFQGFQNGNVLLSNFNGFPGVTRVAASRINAVAPFNSAYGWGYND